MQDQPPGIMSRALDRARGLGARARQRVRGLPMRADQRRRGTPVPPSRLIRLVSGADDVAWFLGSGAAASRGIREALGRHGIALEDLGGILDFGCGVGRVLRHWRHLRGPALHGSDCNAELAGWCRRHLDFAHVEINGLDRRLAYPDGTFDLAYALSVFTHLSGPLQAFWMAELTRVLKPGGFLYLTLHGPSYLPTLTPEERARFEAGEPVVRVPGRDGSNYCAVFHPEPYVRSTLAAGLTIVDVMPMGAPGNPTQDVYLLRKP